MLIKSLRMVDFRQFKGEVKIDFSCDKDKNVTVILGDNTFGKTTLLQAFNWCLYNEVRLPHSEMLLNYEVGEDMPEGARHEVMVEIVLIHMNQEYIIMRKQGFEKVKNKVIPLKNSNTVTMSYKDRDGQTQPVNGAHDNGNKLDSNDNFENLKISQMINNILPKKLSSYFFFDTERVQDVSERKDLATAVKGLLGLSVLDNGIKHLGYKEKKNSVIGRFYQELGAYSSDEKIPEAIERIGDYNKKRSDFESRLKKDQVEKEQYEHEKARLDGLLANNENSKDLQNQRSYIELEIKKTEESLTKTTADLQKYLSSDLKFFLAQPLIDKALDMIEKNPVNNKGIEGLTASVLKGILKRGTCVCGQKIEVGNDAYKHIMEEIKYVPPASIGTLVQSYKSSLNFFRGSGQKVQKTVNVYFDSLSKNRVDHDKLIDVRDDLTDKLSHVTDTSEIESQRRHVVNRITVIQEKDARINQEIGKIKSEINRLNNYVSTHAGDSEQIKKINLCIAYAEAVLDWIKKSYQEKERDTRQQLEKKVTEIFNKMYTGKRTVRIDDNYQVHLITEIPSNNTTKNQSEKETSDSEGLLRVRNFAFIAGLVALAKEKIIADVGSKSIDLSSEPYPLVMDAPFSNADEHHTKNISKILPEVAEQVIMFVMRKDWNYAEKVMSNKVGTMYRLNKISETNTKLERI